MLTGISISLRDEMSIQDVAPAHEHHLAAIFRDLADRIHEVIRPWVARSPQAPALAEAGRRWTYAELARPAEIVLLDALPTNPTGKILKQQLAQRAAATRSPS